MFYNYEIRNNNSEEILYLYLNMKYEFSNEFSLEDDIDLARRSKNFIQNNNIEAQAIFTAPTITCEMPITSTTYQTPQGK